MSSDDNDGGNDDGNIPSNGPNDFSSEIIEREDDDDSNGEIR